MTTDHDHSSPRPPPALYPPQGIGLPYPLAHHGAKGPIMLTTQRAALVAGVIVFLIYGIALSITGESGLGRTWLIAAALGAVVYGLTGFVVGVVQGASQARQEFERRARGESGGPGDGSPPRQP